jgi:hypothetical protein
MDLTLKEKYLLTRIEPKLFYLKFYSSIEVQLGKTLVKKIINNAYLLGNN